MNPPWLNWIAGGLIVGFLLGLLIGRGHATDPAILARVDTVLVAGAVHHDTVVVVKREARIAGREAAAYKGQADKQKAVADSIRAASGRPSAAQPAITSAEDSVTSRTEKQATVPVSAYDSLSQAYASLSNAYAAQTRQVASLMALATIDSTRIATLESTLRVARAELARAKRPSRFGLGCAGGYGVAIGGGQATTGPGLTCGVAMRLF